MVDNTEMENWIKRIIKSEKDYKKYVINCYEKTVNSQNNFNGTSFFDAISMLGTKINIEN